MKRESGIFNLEFLCLGIEIDPDEEEDSIGRVKR